jgi:two-component system NtrC family sensor kinase
MQLYPGTVLTDHAAREDLLEAVIGASLDCLIVINEAGEVVEFNPAAERIFGHAREATLGRSIAELIVPERHRAAHSTGLARLVATGEARLLGRRVEIEALRADGSEFPVELALAEVRAGGRRLFVASLRDLTQQQRSREALLQAEKLAAMGSLLAGVSHELNNPLAAMIGQTIMLEEDLAGRPEADRAAKVRAAAERCARIVQTFLAMARQRPPVRQPVDVNAVIRDALRIAGYGLRTAGIAVEEALAAAMPVIPADPDQLHQVVINLIVNAQQALQESPGERRLRVATRRQDDSIVVEIADNGPGVPPKLAPRIFEPFFTTKPMGSGTGVGLSFAQGIVEAHGGRLALAEAARGACFRITLPLAEDAVDGACTSGDPEAPDGRSILVVDDEPEVADTLAEMLRRDGHRVAVAPSAAGARAAIAGGGIELILSDLGMPGEDGMALHAWLRGAHPGLAARTIFVTGDTLGARAQSFLHDCGQPVIEKPFTPASLRAALAAVTG